MSQIQINSNNKSSNSFIFNGKEYVVPFPVINFNDKQRGMSFHTPSLEDHWDERTDKSGSKINTIVLHWDVATSSSQCFQVLVNRGLSVHLMIDRDGTVYQALDLVKRAWQARGVNDQSIGIEINNQFYINRQDPNWPRQEIYSRDPRSGIPYKHLDFTEIQKTRVVQVVEALCNIVTTIPRKLPPKGSDGKIITRLLDKNEVKGVVGHFNTSVEKIDPGDSLWPLLYDSFSKPPPYNF
ncbi:N-acetylmuramoyl-L-alanine amidase domain-containing protein [Glomus cerebriforme]|uniref:N-acetylmuramoyl-L-alanine amidase n=1 Tax=Glomus cerebriforme TaxID=658196 RepID=A0A397TG62_9GLOM|nr:N-acetylmuramoyl-L-alanine amidase domain-containing protein [Glomus cerebriforme]